MFPLRVPTAVAAPGSDDRSWPVAGPEGALRPSVLRAWRPPPAPWAAGHRGVDLAARAGQAVRAAAAGRVSFAGPVAGRGVLTIELSGTGDPPLRTSYEPVRATVSRGARVTAGQVVGAMEAGPFHCPAGCLHWGLRRGDRYLDPLSLLPPSMLRGGPSRLLPVFGVPPAQESMASSPAAGMRPRLRATAAPTGPSDLAPTAALAAAAAWAGRRLRGRARRTPGRARSRRRPERAGATGRRLGPAGASGAHRGAGYTEPLHQGPQDPRSRPRTPREMSPAGDQPRTPPRAMATAASVMPSGSSAAPSSMRRTAASTTPWSSTAASRGC